MSSRTIPPTFSPEPPFLPFTKQAPLDGTKKERKKEMNYRREATTPEQKMFDKCDKLYPQLRHGRCCMACLSRWRVRPADHIHHIIGRANLHMRFEILNLIPLCWECHQKIHEGKLTEPISEQHREWLVKQSNKDFKGLLIARGLTKEEYYKQQYERMKGLLL